MISVALDWASMSRLSSRIRVEEGGCWTWTGRYSKSGYGFFDDRDRAVYAHRWLLECLGVAHRGDGLDCDHLCRNRGCLNPDHLEVVPHAVNMARGVNHNSGKAACSKGHPFAGDNLYVAPDGQRMCRACMRAADLAYKNRRRDGQDGK